MSCSWQRHSFNPSKQPLWRSYRHKHGLPTSGGTGCSADDPERPADPSPGQAID